MCLIILPIIRAYIIITNTTIAPPNNVPSDNNSVSVSQEHIERLNYDSDLLSDTSSIIDRIKDRLDRTINYTKSVFFPKSGVQNMIEPPLVLNTQDYNPVLNKVEDTTTSAKPIDYLVAGTEGIAWVVHLCFIMSLRKGRYFNPRGPVLIRALILLLIIVSALLLHSHIKQNPQDDVLPNLSLGFSISVVTLLILYAITLIPGHDSLRDMRSSQFNEVSHCKLFTSDSGFIVLSVISVYHILISAKHFKHMLFSIRAVTKIAYGV